MIKKKLPVCSDKTSVVSILIIQGFHKIHSSLIKVRVQGCFAVDGQVQLSHRVVREPLHTGGQRGCGIPVMKTHLALPCTAYSKT